MRSRIGSLGFVAVLVFGGHSAFAADPPVGFPDIGGMLGLDTPENHGWMAIRVDFEDSYALAGVLWYNNDGTIAFPSVSVGTGFAEGPDIAVNATVVATGVSGESDDWSQCSFNQPIAASFGGLFVIFEFPEGSEFTVRGAGGGPAVGFAANLTEPAGWISGDGETWHRLAGDFGFAVAPVLVPFTDGMLVKSLGGSDGSVPDVPDEFYVTTGPNPFNPLLSIHFGLPQAGHTRIDVYDVRGRHVAQLVDEELLAGRHEVSWNGCDTRGRQVSSGVYFLRVNSRDLSNVKRVTLVK